MLVVIPVCSKDLDISLKNLHYCIDMEDRVMYECLVAFESNVKAGKIIDLASQYFSKVSEFSYDVWKGNDNWPAPQNYAWQTIARHIECTRAGYWFWWEQDAIPLKPRWISTLDAAYQDALTNNKVVAGPVASQSGFYYTAGVAIYPAETSRYYNAAYLTETIPWDVAAGTRDGILNRTHDLSDLIVHVADRQNVHFNNRDDIARNIRDSAVLFHKCKDGSLIDVLQDVTIVKNNGESTKQETQESLVPSLIDQTSWESGLFTFPCFPGNTCYFNCSIIDRDDELWLFARRCRFNRQEGPAGSQSASNDLAIFKIGPNMGLKNNPIIPSMPLRFPYEQWEDPKAVMVDGRVYVSFANWVHYKPWFIRQSFTRLTQDWRKAEVLYELDYGGNSPKHKLGKGHEKNWTWFWRIDSWHCVYTINPHVTLKISRHGEISDKWENPIMELPWAFGEIRGGTMPFCIGDEYLCFFHSALTWIKPKRRYYMGAYTFSSKPPFEIKRITVDPLMVASEEDVRSMGGPLVVFPNGAVLRDEHWIVVYGINDEACGWVKIPVPELNERLKPVGSGLVKQAIKLISSMV